MHRIAYILSALILCGAFVLSERGVAQEVRLEPGDRAVKCLTAEEAAVAIVDDSRQPYFERLRPAEILAKCGVDTTGIPVDALRDSCRSQYARSVLSFAPLEEEALIGFVQAASDYMADTYKTFSTMPWSFIKTDGTLEGGLPHTRGESIVLSEQSVSQMVQAWEFIQSDEERGRRVLRALLGLLLHERGHVFQRMHKDRVAELFDEVWGYRLVDSIAVPDAFWEHVVVNPDGPDMRWVLPVAGDTAIWPVLYWTDSLGSSLAKMQFLPYGITVVVTDGVATPVRDSTGKIDMQLLIECERYTEHFPIVGKHMLRLDDGFVNPFVNLYHPNELMSEMIAIRYMYDFDFVKDVISDEHEALMDESLAPFEAWADQNM